MGRIDQLPRPLRAPARAVKRRVVPAYAWEGDGLATQHFSPFLREREWNARVEYAFSQWFDQPYDLRWRLWVLTSAARSAQQLEGSFVEFGTYRGGCAYVVLSSTEDKSMWLYDTFGGVPGDRLTSGEDYLAGRYADTSVQRVASLLEEWQDRVHIVAGDVFDTVPANDPGPIALAHVDLNAAAPTTHALAFADARLVTGGMLVFDDYGHEGYEDQRAVIDEFFAGRPEFVIALPTGQALVVKH